MLIVDVSLCLECGGCVPLCPEEALTLTFNKLVCDREVCTLCGVCIDFCPVGALEDEEAVSV